MSKIQELILDNKKFVSLAQAEKISGYAKDYLGQLCRAQKIEGKRIGRDWFVNFENLISLKREISNRKQNGFKDQEITKANPVKDFVFNETKVAVKIIDESQLNHPVKSFAKARLNEVDQWDKILFGDSASKFSRKEEFFSFQRDNFQFLKSLKYFKPLVLAGAPLLIVAFILFKNPAPALAALDELKTFTQALASQVSSSISKTVSYLPQVKEQTTRQAAEIFSSLNLSALSDFPENLSVLSDLPEQLFRLEKQIAQKTAQTFSQFSAKTSELGQKISFRFFSQSVSFLENKLKGKLDSVREYLSDRIDSAKLVMSDAINQSGEIISDTINRLKDSWGQGENWLIKKKQAWFSRKSLFEEFPLPEQSPEEPASQPKPSSLTSQEFNQLAVLVSEQLKDRGLIIEKTIVQPTLLEKTIEKIISGLTAEEVDDKLNQLNNKILTQYANLKNLIADRSQSNFQAIALTNKIDNLSGAAISSATITGSTFAGSISGTTASFSGAATFNSSATFNTGATIGNEDSDTLTVGAGVWSLTSSATTTAALTNGLNFDSNTLVIDPNSNRVGILTNTPAYALDVTGDIRATGNLISAGQTISGDFSVTGHTTLGNATTTDIVYLNSRIAGHLVPTADNVSDLGDGTNWLRWRTGYFGTSVGIGGTATSTGSQLIVSGNYLLDSAGTLSINTTNNQPVNFGTGLLSMARASTTRLSVFDALYIGGAATTTLRGDNIASIIPYASTTALTISGTASTTNQVISSLISGRVPFASTAGLLIDSSNFAWNNSVSRLTATYASTTAISGTNIDFGTLTLTSALGIASGGTNASSFTTSGNAVYYNGTSLLTAPLTSAITIPYASTTAITASGTASTTNQVISSLISGRVPFASTAGLLIDSPNLSWNNSASRLTATYASTTAISGTNIDFGTLTLTSALGIASGGTNASSFTTSGNAVYYNGTSLLTAPLTSAITVPYASSTALTVSGTASTTELIVSGSATSTFSSPLASYSGNFIIHSQGTSNNLLFNPYGGNVGIGTTSPGSLLSVQGNGYISSNLFVGGTITSTSSLFSTIPYASTTALTVSGTASTTNQVISSLISGRVPFASTAGLLIDSSNFAWNNSVSRLTATYASTTAISGTNIDFGTLTLTSALGIASGGTNASSFTTSGNAVYYNGTSLLTAPLTSAITVPYASSTALTVSGTASTSQLVVSSPSATSTFSTGGLTVGTSQFVVQQTSGNVGIGTTEPGAKLDVNGVIAGNSTLNLFYSSSRPVLGNTTQTLWMRAIDNDPTGGGIDLQSYSGASIMRLKDGGNVGIGTTNPSQKLHISDSSTSGTSINLQNTDTGGTTWRIISHGSGNTGGAGHLSFWSGATQGLFISSGGNVGIGTTTPWGLLSVNPNGISGPAFVVGSSTQCVTGDTRLRRRKKKKNGEGYDYDEIQIKDIQAGDEIASLDEKTGRIVWSKVKALMDMGVKDIYKLTTALGKTIRTTANHPYLVQKTGLRPAKHNSSIKNAGWLKVSDIKEGDYIASSKPRAGVFIDNANMFYAQKKAGWKIDYIKLKEILSHSFDIKFMNFYLAIPDKSDSAYEPTMEYLEKIEKTVNVIAKPLKYIEVAKGKFEKKGNVDVKIAADVAKTMKDLDVVILLSGDSDFNDLADSVSAYDKKIAFVGFENNMAWELRQKTHLYLNRFREDIELKNNKAPSFGPGVLLLTSLYSNDKILSSSAVDNSNDFIWTRVKSIEKVAEEQVYDIEVEGTHNFIGNDIVAHNTYLTVTNGGNVGIGTTSPGQKLDIEGSNIRLSNAQANLILNDNGVSASQSQVILRRNDTNVGMVQYDHTDSKLKFLVGDGVNTDVTIQTDSNVGIGDTDPTEAKLVVGASGAGDIYATFATANTETLCWDASGASLITDCTSLRKFKENVTDLTLPGIETIMKLSPREFDWIGKEEGIRHDLGFIAEEVDAISPLLASYSIRDAEKGAELNGVKYERMTAVLVKAIQELNLKVEDFQIQISAGQSSSNNSSFDLQSVFSQILAWLEDKVLKVKELVTPAMTADFVYVRKEMEIGTSQEPRGITLYDEDTGEPYCLTIKSGAIASKSGKCVNLAANPPVENVLTDIEPPIITIYGNNPAEIPVGTNYGDLGASAQDNIDGDISILIRTYVNGAEMAPVQIDTSTTTVYVIDYAVSDQAGNIATSSRQVIVF